MSLKIIRKAFETRLATWAITVPVDVAYENVAYKRTFVSYIEMFMLPAQTTSQYMAQNDRSYLGIVQFNINIPHNLGTSLAHGYAEAIANLYQVSFVQDGMRIYTQPAYELPSQTDETHFTLIIRLPYRSEVA